MHRSAEDRFDFMTIARAHLKIVGGGEKEREREIFKYNI